MNDRVQTHSLGLACSVCRGELVPDACSCHTPHGFTFQEPTPWAAKTWPEHGCFRG